MTRCPWREQAALHAAGWCGVREGSEAHGEILKLYNSLTPLPRGYRMTGRDAWCAAFVSAVAVETGIEGLFPVECSCARMVEKAKTMGIWEERDDFVPDTGDLVLYNWDAGGAGDDTGVPDHVGMVLLVKGTTIHVVEGNYDNAVRVRRIAVDDRRIRGFVCPKYEGLEADERMVYHRLEEVPTYARATIEKLVADGSLRGVAEDDLALSEEQLRIFVILDRRGKL